MAMRVTVVGRDFFSGDEQAHARALAEIVESVERCGGNLARVAHELCISRRHLYRIVWRANLWAKVDAARVRFVVENVRNEPDWLRRTRSELR